MHGVEIDVYEYGPLGEDNGTCSCACVDEAPCAEKPCAKHPSPAGQLCPARQRECNWQGRSLAALSASVAAVAIFVTGLSVRCRHELELERLRLMEQAALHMRISSAESAVMEAQRRADEALSAVIATQSSENEQDILP